MKTTQVSSSSSTPPASTSASTPPPITQKMLDDAFERHNITDSSQILENRHMSVESSDCDDDDDVFYDSQEELKNPSKDIRDLFANSPDHPDFLFDKKQNAHVLTLNQNSAPLSIAPPKKVIRTARKPGFMREEELSVTTTSKISTQPVESIKTTPLAATSSVSPKPKQSFFKKTLKKIANFLQPKTPEFKLDLTSTQTPPIAKKIHIEAYEIITEIRRLRNTSKDTNTNELALYRKLNEKLAELKEISHKYPMVNTFEPLRKKLSSKDLTLNYIISEIDPILKRLFPPVEQHEYAPTNSLPEKLSKTLNSLTLTTGLISPTAKEIHKHIYEIATLIRKFRNTPLNTNEKELKLYSVLKHHTELLKDNLPSMHPMRKTLENLNKKLVQDNLTINYVISEIDPILNYLFPAAEQPQYAATDSLPKRLKEALTFDLGLADRYNTTSTHLETKTEKPSLERFSLLGTFLDQNKTDPIEDEVMSEDASDIFDGPIDYAHPQYEYEAVDLFLLQESFKKKELNDITIMGPLDIKTLKIEDQLTGFILAAQNSNQPVFSIVNTGHGHWVLLSLIKDSNGKVHALCKNSTGNPTDELKELFIKREISYHMHHEREQAEGSKDCGLFAMKNMLLMAEMAKTQGTDHLRDHFTNFQFCKQDEMVNLRAEYANRLYTANAEAEKNLFSSK